MIHEVGKPIPIPEETLEWATSVLKREPYRAFGLAVDDLVKHAAMRKLECFIPPKYHLYDIQTGDLKIEIKSTSGDYFNFSDSEYRHIRDHVLESGFEFKVLFYVNDLEAKTTTFIGALNSSFLLAERAFHISTTISGIFLNSWYLERAHVEKAIQSGII